MKNFILKALLYVGLLALIATPIFFSANKDMTTKEEPEIKEEENKVNPDDLLKDDDEEGNEKENYEVVKFYSYDEKVRFTILNTAGYPPLALESLKRDLDIVYKDINFETKDYFSQQSEVYVTLKVDLGAEDMLEAGSGYMNLYNYDPETEWLHYLTVQAIFKDDQYYKEYSRLPREILALYFEIFYGVVDADPYASEFISYLDEEGHRIPLKDLLSAEKYNASAYDEYVTEEILMEYEINYYWFVHLQAISFATFFIDTYGMDDFASLYDHEDLVMAVEEISGKSLSALEKEWLDYIELNYMESDNDSDSL
ncbi:hypothetical protein CIB95_03370 [Lottiidibacillus patelloidae]|uniref:Uncharacterized protein n=1 Tax=Lottiidibacillus patelloidae TaxID=2670334 RepID=A0A263BXY0_9BACI|nr:hypothetical protein [Lottiidibacillus patelloidae]OZM58621.1 hypothetical protein CIB95_03370 [Lottiidibacillus patelloidae]